MARLIYLLSLLICFGDAIADSGGPYIGVPDLKSSEEPPTFAIPNEERPLRFFLLNIPELRWNNQLGEPDSYIWRACAGHHASVISLGRLNAHEVLCIRYVSDQQLDRGADHAEVLLLLSVDPGTESKPALCSPILYLSASANIYDHKAAPYAVGKTNAVVITSYYGGKAGFQDCIYIREGEQGFERFTPKKQAR